MDRKTVIALANKAGLHIDEGNQDRLLYDTPIVDALAKFAKLANEDDLVTVRVSLEHSPNIELILSAGFNPPAMIDTPLIELQLPGGCTSLVIDAIEKAFREGEKSAKASIAKMLKTAP